MLWGADATLALEILERLEVLPSTFGHSGDPFACGRRKVFAATQGFSDIGRGRVCTLPAAFSCRLEPVNRVQPMMLPGWRLLNRPGGIFSGPATRQRRCSPVFSQGLRSELLAASFVAHRRSRWRRVGAFTIGFTGHGNVLRLADHTKGSGQLSGIWNTTAVEASTSEHR
jgi:hypothetical protein